MTQSSLAMIPVQAPRASAARRVTYRTPGRSRGPITRLISPGDLGEMLKPFVFLDHFETAGFQGGGFAAHPHSGIATHTTLIAGTFDYGDSTGKSGTLRAGNVEWMQAGGDVWHWGDPRRNEPTRGYQLWVALPKELEHAPAVSHYIDTPHVASDGKVRVLLGTYGGLASPISYHEPLTYLHVTLKDGERWTFQPNAGHDVGWLAVHKGALGTSGLRLERELVVFEEGPLEIALVAIGDTELVIGSARKHEHPLVCGSYSVHTSLPALMRGEREIAVIGQTAHVLDAIRRTSR